MRLGFAVKVLGADGLPSHDTRRHGSNPHLRVSLEYLTAILDYLDDNDIRMYRMATALAPYRRTPTSRSSAASPSRRLRSSRGSGAGPASSTSA